jgi:predicted amidohydrolase
MKIGIVQFAPILGNLHQTIHKLENLLAKCSECELVLLPELANSGYNFPDKQAAVDSAESVADSVFLEYLWEKCNRFKYHIITGFNEKERSNLYNSAIIIGKNGLVGKYRKTQLFMKEPGFFEKGNSGLPIFQIGEFKIGILICFDWMFPELWRHLALKGADLIVHPSNLVLPYAQGVVPSYAITNRLFVATINRVGSEGDLTFTGGSLIANPKAEVVGSLSSTAEDVLICDIDLTESRDKMITPFNHAFDDRRLDVYPDLENLIS